MKLRCAQCYLIADEKEFEDGCPRCKWEIHEELKDE